MNSILATSIEFANLGIKLNNVGKSISIFGVDIAYYGMIIATGMILGIIVTCAEAKRTGQDPNDYIDFAIYAIIFSVIGARLYYVIFSWDYYKKNPGQILNIRGGGLAIYGGIIAAIITCFVYTRIKKMSMPRVMDTAVLGLILGQILGRWGNFFNREAFGGVASGKNPFAMKIYFDSHYSITQVPDSVREGMEKMFGKTLEQIGYIQVHPTFLYESCWNLVLLIILLIFRDKKKYNTATDAKNCPTLDLKNGHNRFYLGDGAVGYYDGDRDKNKNHPLYYPNDNSEEWKQWDKERTKI